MRNIISKTLNLNGISSFDENHLANQITEEINEQCPAGYCFKQILESLSDIGKTKGRCGTLFTANNIVVIYQKID